MNRDQKLQDFIDSLHPEHKGMTPNSWEWVRSARELLLTDTDQYPYRSSVEEMWEYLEGFYIYDEKQLVHREEEIADSPAQALISYAEKGYYPPFEVLIAIANVFDIYFKAQGAVSLDEIFFGHSKKGVGNYSAQLGRFEMYNEFSLFEVLVRAGIKKMPNLDQSSNMEAIAEHFFSRFVSAEAEEVISLDLLPDIDSFLRGYRRWKSTMSNGEDS